MALSSGTHPITPCHVVAVPYPGRGHVNPMMNLCKLLTKSQPKLVITFVVTEEWLGFIGSDNKPANIRFATIPNVLPSELDRAKDMPGFLSATQTKMAEPFEHLLDRLDEPVNLIIADTSVNWAVDVGNRRNIPVASLWTMPAAVFSILYHFDLIRNKGHHPFDVLERGEERLEYIPGIASIRLADIPSIAHTIDQCILHLFLRLFNNVPKAQYLLLTSILELEPQVIDALKQEFPFPIYTFGPVIPYSNLDKALSFTPYFDWLNSQPPNSVLYVSLGSFLSISNTQMDEIANGLRESGIRFLWVARGESERLKEKCGDLGRVVPWCEQLQVLCHPSVGGFWTHCGWNSTMECIYAGVPIIAFPIAMDQMTNRKLIVDDWKIGLDARREMGTGDLIRSREFAKLVKRFMDLESVERKEMTRRARELREVTRGAMLDGGSSKNNINSFLHDITLYSSTLKDNGWN